jgi:hypothetical protein
METNTLPKNEGQEAFEIVLKEFVEEQANINKSNADIITAVNQLTGRVNGFAETLKNQKIVVPEPDTKAMYQVVRNGTEDVKILIETMLNRFKSNNMRVFLESDAKKWAVILILGVVFLTYMYILMSHS